MKIAKKFREELKLANLEKEELIVRLNKSNKKNEFLRNQLSSKDEKMKSLEQELFESKAKLENLTSTKPAVSDKCVSVSLKPKAGKIYIPPFKRNHKEKAYVATLDKGKRSDVDAEVSKPKSKPAVRKHKKSVFVPTCHLYGGKNQNLRLDLLFLMFLNLFMIVTFVVLLVTFVLAVIN